jgi:HTH-type transcriptional regulator/antitoxin HipB
MEYHIKTLDQLRPILVGLRKQVGLSQMSVASLLGISQQSYAKIEANPSATSVERLFIILSLLGVEIVLNERTPSTDWNQTSDFSDSEGTPAAPPRQGSDRPEVSSSQRASQLMQKKGRKTPSAPEKLLPPSNKTENW